MFGSMLVKGCQFLMSQAIFDQPIHNEHGWSGPDGPEYCHLPHLNSLVQLVVAYLRVSNGCHYAERQDDLQVD